MKSYSSLVLRVGLALVMLWFGTSQMLHAGNWVGFLPDWTHVLPFSDTTLITLNGFLEIILGILLGFGFFTRVVAGLLLVHLIGITISLGWSATAVRDFGIVIGLASVFLHGKDSYSLDTYFS